MLRFAFRAGLPAPGLAASLLGAVVAASALAGCTVTPDYFPPCVNPYVDTCPVGDGSADGDDSDGGGAAPDATAAIDAPNSPDATTNDEPATESGQATMQ